MFRRRRQPLLAPLLAIAAVVLVAGVWLGGHPSWMPGFVRDAFTTQDESTAVVDEGLDIIEDDYYRKVPRPELADDALGGAVQRLQDRFSNYLDPKTYQQFQQSTDGRFSGIGISVGEDPKGLRVANVYAGSPAGKAGLRTGDVIVAVNGKAIAGKPQSIAVAMIKGKPGTSVRLTVETDGKRRAVPIERAEVAIPSVESEMVEENGVKIGHLTLSGFTSGAHGEVRQAVDRLRKRGAKAIVFDLRNNGGGLLNEAVLTASIFIPDGTIVSTDGRARNKQVFTATGGAIPMRIPVVVLVNRGSASASEIVAGALQDRKRAKLLGTRTFGKGVFQEIKQLSNGGALDITVGEYFLPSGRNIGGGGVRIGQGLKPNIEVPQGKTGDRQLQAAERELVHELRR